MRAPMYFIAHTARGERRHIVRGDTIQGVRNADGRTLCGRRAIPTTNLKTGDLIIFVDHWDDERLCQHCWSAHHKEMA